MNISTKNKKALAILLLVSLTVPTLSILTVFPAPVYAPGGKVDVSVQPASVGPIPVGGTFFIIVQLNNLKPDAFNQGMFAYNGRLTYNTLTLTATAANAQYTSPAGGVCSTPGSCEDITPETITDSLGEVTWEVALVGFPSGFVGSGGTVRIDFRVDAKGTSPLDITTQLFNAQFNDIPHNDIDGTFFVNPVKTAPVAVLLPAGPLTINVKEKVLFDGSTSRDTNSPVQPLILYTFTVNGAVAQSGAMQTFSFTTGTPGNYNVCLVVRNESGMDSAADCTAVTVNAIKNPPTAVMTPDGPLKISVKETVLFDGSGSHDNSNPLQSITDYTFTVNGAVAQSGLGTTFSFTTGTPGTYTVCLVVKNQSGLSSSPDCTTVTVNAIKRAPTAVLTGPTKVDFKVPAVFDGSGSFDNSNPVQSITNYRFTVNGATAQSGPGATFSFTATSPGVYTICLVVTNESNMDSLPDCQDLTVNAVKRDPTAVLTPAGPLKITRGETVLFDGSGSRDNSNPLQSITDYTFTVNGAVAQSGANTMFSFTPTAGGLYTVCLVVKNESGLTGTDCTDVTVNVPEKFAPIAVLTGPTKLDFKVKAVFDGSGSHDDPRNNPQQAIIRYDFRVNGALMQSGLGSSFSFTAASPGVYNVCLVVFNESMLPSAPSCITLTVNAVKRAPTAVLTPAGPIKITVGEKITFDGSTSFDNSNPVQGITRYVFTVNGVVAQSGAMATFSFSPAAPGPYTVCLTVFNESGMESPADCTDVTVNPGKARPTAVITGPVKIDFKLSATYDGSGSSDPNQPPQAIIDYTFTVNGVTAQSGPSASFSFTPASPGVYTVCLVVTNDSGLRSDPDCIDTTVNAVKRDPTAVLVPDGPLKISVKETVLFDGSGSRDNSNPVQPIIRYTFSVNGMVAQSGAMATFSFTTGTPGDYTVCLVVVNESGLMSAPDCTTVTVNAIKAPPTAVITGPAKVSEGANVIYSGAGSHDNSNPTQTLRYEWMDKTNGVVLGTGVEQKVTFGPPGTLLLSLTVCNTSNLCDRAELLITINERKLPVTADLVPPKGSAAYATEPVRFTVRIFTGTPSFTCGLGFGDGNSMTFPCLDGDTVPHVYRLPGTYTATLNVTDANGSFTSSSEDVTVQPEPRFFRGKLSWKHHLTTVQQTFSAKITNPSKYNALVTVTITFVAPDGTVPSPPASATFKLGPMSSNTDAQIFFDATMLGKYCFTATLTYQVDVNGDGIIDITGTGPNTKSGCFNRV